MVLDYTTAYKVRVDMRKYLQNLLEDLPKHFDGDSTTPAAEHLFDVNDNSTKLSEEHAIFFHTIVYKLLFLCKRARPDIQTTITFLTTRVSCPDEDDYKKLTRVIAYLQAAKCLVLTLEGDKSGNIKWWIDASFAVHNSIRSHTGGAMTLRKGIIYDCSTK